MVSRLKDEGRSGMSPLQHWAQHGIDHMLKAFPCEKTYPEPQRTGFPEHLPEPVRRAYRVALKDFDDKDRNEQTCIMLRKTLELATKDLLGADGEGKSLNNRIDMLAKQGRLTNELKDWAHHVRALGNEFVHDSVPTREETEDMETFVRLICMYAYTLPAMLAARQSNKPLA